MLTRFLLSASLLLATPALAVPIIQHVEPSRSDLTFQSRTNNLPFAGHIRSFSGQVLLDPALQEVKKVSFITDLRDAELSNSPPQLSWIFAGLIRNLQVSTVSFLSTSVRRSGASSFDALGTVSSGSRQYQMTIPINVVSIDSNSSHFTGRVNGSVSPSQLPEQLSGTLSFDLLCSTKR